jgi:hypothetical protein
MRSFNTFPPLNCSLTKNYPQNVNQNHTTFDTFKGLGGKPDLLGRPTAVDGERGSCDVARRPTGQVEGQAADLMELAPTTDRNPRDERRVFLRVVGERQVHFRGKRPGHKGIDRDLLMGQLQGQRPRELQDGSLARGLSRSVRKCYDREHRGDVDDPGVTVLRNDRHDFAAHEPSACHVHSLHQLEIGRRDLFNRAADVDASRVDEDVDLAEFGDGRADRGLDLLWNRNITNRG